MECVKCQQKIPDGLTFCPYCGARFADNARREEQKRERQKEADERARREREQQRRANDDLDRIEREAIEREKKRDEQVYEVDPDKIYLHDAQDDDFGGGFFDIFGGGFGGFGGSIFGDIFGGGSRRQSGSYRRTASFGGGLFDIIDSLFGGGGGFGGAYGGGRARLKAEDDYYYQEPKDEDGIPILDEDEVIDLSPKELERRNKEWDKRNNRRNNSKKADDQSAQ